MPPKPKKTPPNPYPTISDEFNRDYDGELGQLGKKSGNNNGSVSNARSVRYMSDEKYLAKGERGRKALARRDALTYAPGQNPEEITPNQNNNPANQKTKPAVGLIRGSINQNLGRIRSFPIGASILVWSVPYYFTIYLPLAVLSSLSLGMSWYLGSLTTNGTGIISPLVEGTGLGHDSFLIIYFGLTIVLIFFSLIELIIAIAQFKIAFLHPLMGERGTFSKLLFAFLSIIGCIIPGGNIFPFFFIWLLFAVLNPR